MKLVRSEKGLRPATSRQVLTYEKEEQSQRKAVSDMKAGGAEAYDVKKKQELLEQAKLRFEVAKTNFRNQ